MFLFYSFDLYDQLRLPQYECQCRRIYLLILLGINERIRGLFSFFFSFFFDCFILYSYIKIYQRFFSVVRLYVYPLPFPLFPFYLYCSLTQKNFCAGVNFGYDYFYKNISIFRVKIKERVTSYLGFSPLYENQINLVNDYYHQFNELITQISNLIGFHYIFVSL